MLSDRLSSFAKGQDVFVWGNYSIDCHKLSELLSRLRATLNNIQNVAVTGDCDLSIAVAMLALDGYVSRILLLTPDLSREKRDVLLKVAGIEGTIEVVFHAATIHWTIQCTNNPPASSVPCTETEWLISTSGTTGEEKVVKHSLVTLSRSTTARQCPDIRWGLTYSIHRFAGLQVFLQAMSSGSTLVLPPQGSNLAQTITCLIKNKVNAISATPSWWRKSLMNPEAVHLTPKRITLGGEIADQKIISSLSTLFPHARIVHIYASTEAGVGFVVSDGKAGFPLSYLHSPQNGVQLKISADGSLLIKAPKSAMGYLQSSNFADEQGFLNTGDLVETVGDRVMFRGRQNGSINVGGNKVMPEEVEDIILAFPGVQQCIVFGLASPIMGTLVAAKIIYEGNLLREGVSKALKGHCRERLPPYKVPVKVMIVDHIPILPSGKLDRKLDP